MSIARRGGAGPTQRLGWADLGAVTGQLHQKAVSGSRRPLCGHAQAVDETGLDLVTNGLFLGTVVMRGIRPGCTGRCAVIRTP